MTRRNVEYFESGNDTKTLKVCVTSKAESSEAIARTSEQELSIVSGLLHGQATTLPLHLSLSGLVIAAGG